MKTKNLTAWCNLFSIESKYSLKVTPSKLEALLNTFLSLVVPALWLVLFPLTNPYLSNSYWLFAPLSIWLVYSERKRFLAQKAQAMTITTNGECMLEDINYYLSNDCRIGALGILLKLCNAQQAASNSWFKPKSVSKRLFIYKDSLSKKDYVRLSRIVLKSAGKSTDQPN